ncbi:fanconi anemia group j protein [Anaeramoeba flamelloides]|uniref:Fanconi anemia group j protein n=1 Tax=Anaeramoeba flamelloides TaxID=1746091 RepID=A0ABQ8X8Y5_9EUKA|nr:fanconi anemia group j protein [Anaeramoeba flamelloides]
MNSNFPNLIPKQEQVTNCPNINKNQPNLKKEQNNSDKKPNSSSYNTATTTPVTVSKPQTQVKKELKQTDEKETKLKKETINVNQNQNKKTKQQYFYQIGKTRVVSPYSFYESQIMMSEKMIDGFENCKSCLLESPTGTGKSVVLLCTPLSWRLGHLLETSTAPKIFLSSHTHSQLKQLIRELKKTPHKPNMTLLASRKHYCINDRAKSKKNLNLMCRKFVRQKKCKYYQNFENHEMNHKAYKLSSKVWDMEDLIGLGESCEVCPYYLARALQKESDLIFCPYNYLIEPTIRKNLKIDLDNEVVIIDEAHNIENVCREVLDFSTDSKKLAITLRECKGISQRDQFVLKPLFDPMIALGFKVFNMINQLKRRMIKDRYGNKYFHSTGFPLLELLAQFEMSENKLKSTLINWKSILKQIGSKYQDNNNDLKKFPELSMLTQKLFEDFFDALFYIYRDPTTYALVIVEKPVERNQGNYHGRNSRYNNRNNNNSSSRSSEMQQDQEIVSEFFLWCLSPKISYQDAFAKSRSVVLASGTLSPLKSFSSELGEAFNITLKAPHIINLKEQAHIANITRTLDGKFLTLNYKSLQSNKVLDSVGQIILNYCRIVPDGILVFFSSYTMRNKMVARWRKAGILESIRKTKQIFIEPNSSNQEFTKMIQDYYDIVDAQSGYGAICFAIYRGKVSEGLDFSDSRARATILLGIPFPSLKSLNIQEKKNYNTKYHDTKRLLDGNDWYELQAFRALNQAMGRCLRHKNDYGAILLIDDRFQNRGYKINLVDWIQNSINTYKNWNQCFHDLKQFFHSEKIKEIDVLNKRKNSFQNDLSRVQENNTFQLKNESNLIQNTALLNYSNQNLINQNSNLNPFLGNSRPYALNNTKFHNFSQGGNFNNQLMIANQNNSFLNQQQTAFGNVKTQNSNSNILNNSVNLLNSNSNLLNNRANLLNNRTNLLNNGTNLLNNNSNLLNDNWNAIKLEPKRKEKRKGRGKRKGKRKKDQQKKNSQVIINLCDDSSTGDSGESDSESDEIIDLNSKDLKINRKRLWQSEMGIEKGLPNFLKNKSKKKINHYKNENDRFQNQNYQKTHSNNNPFSNGILSTNNNIFSSSSTLINNSQNSFNGGNYNSTNTANVNYINNNSNSILSSSSIMSQSIGNNNFQQQQQQQQTIQNEIFCSSCEKVVYSWQNNMENLDLVPKSCGIILEGEYQTFYVLGNQQQISNFNGEINKEKTQTDEYSLVLYQGAFCSCGVQVGIKILNSNQICLYHNFRSYTRSVQQRINNSNIDNHNSLKSAVKREIIDID